MAVNQNAVLFCFDIYAFKIVPNILMLIIREETVWTTDTGS